MKHVGAVTATAADGTKVPNPGALVIVGPLVNVVLAVPESVGRAMLALGREPPRVDVKLLIDTGAQITSVHDEVAAQLGLPPIRMAPMVGVSGKPEDYPVYRMVVLIAVADATGKGIIGLETDVVGVPASAGHAEMKGLLGRDFLRHLRLVYDGPTATFELSEQIIAKPADAKSPLGSSPGKPRKAKRKMEKQSRKHNRGR